MASMRRIFRPSVRQILKVIAELDESQLGVLQIAVTSSDAFDTSPDRCKALAQRLDGDEETVAFTISTLAFLYAQVHGRSDDVPFGERVASLLGDFSDEDAKVISRLQNLLAVNDNAESFIKQQRLKVGFLDNAISFSSFVDVRPVFSKDHDSIESYVSVVQMKIALDDNQSEGKSVVFQIDERGLRSLQETVDDIEKKLALAKKALSQLSK